MFNSGEYLGAVLYPNIVRVVLYKSLNPSQNVNIVNRGFHILLP
jgi:hypothetical protein